MKTYLDRGRTTGKTFLMYGNMNDVYYQGDLVPRNFEQMLVHYLKSRGYKHVIFYGEDGTKGAFCLDKVSAKFFFHENRQDTFVKETKNGDAPTKKCETPNASGSLADMISRKSGSRYGKVEGTLSGDISDKNQTEHAEPKKKEPRIQQFRYARRNMRLSEFLQMIFPLMLDKESHMAVVFYNIFTTDINQYQALRNSIMDVWEKRDMENCCILLAPDTLYEQESLIQCIQGLNMQSRFLIREDNRYLFNPRTCCRVGFPLEDEVKNLLKRYIWLGTAKDRKKVKLSYQELDEVAEEIVFCSRFCSKEERYKELSFEYLKEIRGRIEDWILEAGKDNESVFTVEEVRKLWKVPLKDKQTALEQLNRPGWENVYQVLKDLYDTSMKKMDVTECVQEVEEPDWAVRRIVSETGSLERSYRQSIPNFILMGNPGTGKTTIARLIGQLLKELGILRRGHTVEVTKKDLTSSFVAGVPQATMACVEQAEEGVLFIDEAHALGKKDGGVNHEGTGIEVISTLCAAMTDPSRHFSLILAGYEQEMEAVLKLDPGFERRFDGRFIVIDDYRPEILKKILLKCFQDNGYHVSEELTEEIPDGDQKTTRLDCMLKRMYAERNRTRFGNADVMVRLAQYAMDHCEGRLITETSLYKDKIRPEWFMPANIKHSSEAVFQELKENFVGMNEICSTLEDICEEIKEAKVKGKDAIEIIVRSMILCGNPGTGKTTVAKMLARLLFSLGVLGSSEPIILHASQLASRYMGGSQEMINEKIKEAQERQALLFIDEAHNLCSNTFDGQGVLKAFMAPLTDAEHPLITAFAVYPDCLEEFKALDPGVNRRLYEIKLRDYTGEELYEILKLMMKKEGYDANEEAAEKLQRLCHEIYENRTNTTGNAGKMERLLEEMHKKRRRRCKNRQIPFGTQEADMFLEEDIPDWFEG